MGMWARGVVASVAAALGRAREGGWEESEEAKGRKTVSARCVPVDGAKREWGAEEEYDGCREGEVGRYD